MVGELALEELRDRSRVGMGDDVGDGPLVSLSGLLPDDVHAG